jgi:hypothetical protein
LKKQRTHHIVSRTDDVLSFIILRRGVGTQHPQEHAVGEEGPSARVVKLAPVIALDGLDGGAELCGNIGKEIG